MYEASVSVRGIMAIITSQELDRKMNMKLYKNTSKLVLLQGLAFHVLVICLICLTGVKSVRKCNRFRHKYAQK